MIKESHACFPYFYLPPPAHAQAQPAQAQAQAHECPPPPPPRNPPLPLLGDEVCIGTGFVLLVIALVKPVMSPITPAAKVEAPLTIDAAKSEPGICGKETEGLPPAAPLPELTGAAIPPLPPIVSTAGRMVGS